MAEFKQNYFQRRARDKGPRFNHRINSPEVQVIASNGENLGIINTNKAISMAKEEGLDTCPQEAWSTRPESVSSFVEAGEEIMLFCGMAIGYIDDTEPVNNLVTEREPFDVWAKFVEK